MKKKLCSLLLAALLCAGAALAEGSDFSDVAGIYELASGVGAWYTELTVQDDGSFHGHYQDTDMEGGELDGAAYEATIYTCDFTGSLTALERADAQELDCRVAELNYGDGAPYAEDGALYVPTDPAGLNQGDSLRFFMEGSLAEALPEGFLVWVRMREGAISWQEMPYRGLYNETADAGFSGVEAAQTQQAVALWEFFPAASEEASDAFGQSAATPAAESPAREGIEYPIYAEVVNCTTGVSLRGGPSTKAALLAEVPLGSQVTLYSNAAWLGNERWFVEASYNGQRGYICVEYLDAILPESLRYQREYLKGLEGTVSAVNPGSDLILRDGPGSDHESLGLLFGGEVLGYLGEAKKDASGTCWYHCSHYGEPCWISAKFTALTLNDGTTYTGSRGIY